MRPRKDVIRVDMPQRTDEMIQARVAPLLPNHVLHYWNGSMLATVVRAAYVQGALDAMIIAEKYPELIAQVRAQDV